MGFFLKLLDLPDEMLSEIFGYVKPMERLQMLTTCQRIHDVIVSDKSLMKDIEMVWNYKRIDSVQQFVSCINHSKRCYTSLLICMDPSMEMPSLETFTAIKGLPSLVELSLYQLPIEIEDLASIVNSLMNLEVLNISGRNLKNTRGYLGKLELKKLKKLNIEFGSYETFPEIVINSLLSELQFGCWCPWIFGEAEKFVISLCAWNW